MKMVSRSDDFNPAFQQQVENYLRIITEQKHYSEHTSKSYKRQLNVLLAHLHSIGVMEWKQVKPVHIRQMSARQHRLGKSSKSIALLLSSARSFFQYLIDREGLLINPAKNIRPPKGESKLPNTMDVDQVFLLLDNIDTSTSIGIRDKAIAELFYSSGLRLAELISCDLIDIDLCAGIARVTGKGNKARIVPVGRKAVEAIQKWVEERTIWLGPIVLDALFISKQNKRLSNRSVQKRLEYWGKRVGLNSNLHPHKFRHSCATHILESSGDIRAVQELLGHADISTTQVYTHLDFQKLAEVYDRSHPRARKK